MKSFFLILVLVVFGNTLVFAQESDDKEKIVPIYEITFSLNRTTVADANTENRFGFGMGLYYTFFNQKRCNLITGLEYNRNVQLKKHTYGGHFSNNYNVRYTINNLGLPLYFRVNMGQKVMFFVEAGAFLDFIIAGREKGEYKTIISIDSTTKKYDGKFDNPISYKMPNFGISGGIGLRIPVKGHEIVVKVDYKWGMRNINKGYESLYNKYWRFTLGFKPRFNEERIGSN
jgi:hypothetical protein